MIAIRKLIVLVLAAATLSLPAWAQGRIELVATSVGRTPDSLSVQEPGELKTYQFKGNTVRATIPHSRSEVIRLPAWVRYGDVSLPLLLQVRPRSTRISFLLSIDQPESCSLPHAQAVSASAATPDAAMRRALTAGFMLWRTGQFNTCRDHRNTVLEARFRRYMELASSPDFQIPQVVKREWLEASNYSPSVQRVIALAERTQQEVRVVALQEDVRAAQFDDPVLAANSSRLMLAAAEESADVAEITYGLITRRALTRQTFDLQVRADNFRASSLNVDE
jgi:hypothetical protein